MREPLGGFLRQRESGGDGYREKGGRETRYLADYSVQLSLCGKDASSKEGKQQFF